MNKQNWLNQHIMSDEWGREPSLADVPLTIMKRKRAFELRKYTKKKINEIWIEAKKNARP
tara:strand:- start:19445 stop:19624 length:180 start_codon:yes stop_codon:yes gene_type:complete